MITNNNKYNKSIIYAIKHNNEPIYIGSTTDFNRRKILHKSDCNNDKSKQHNYDIYKYIRELGGWNKITIEKIMNFNCNTKKELNLEEGRVIKEYIGAGYNLKNKCIAGRTKKEWYKNNADKIKDHHKKNADKIKEYQKEYRKIRVLCDCGKMITKATKLQHIKSAYHIRNIKKD